MDGMRQIEKRKGEWWRCVVQGSGRTNGVFEGAGGLVVDAADCGACYGGAVMGVGEEGVAAPGAMQFQNSAWL